MNIILKTLLIGWAAFGATLDACAEVTSGKENGRLDYFASGKPVLSYHLETVQPPAGMDPVYARSGFIHPLYSPSGKVLTDDFPVGHAHQHAVFSAWTRTTFKHEMVDFWNQHKGTGTAEHVRLRSVSPDSFTADLRQVSLKKGKAIDEQWTVAVRETEDTFIVDVDIDQRCATDEEIYLHQYLYGGFGLRASAHWNQEDQARYTGPMKVLTGEGVTNVEESNHTRPRWVAVHGIIEGDSAGFVVMDHPANFRYPQPVRVHPEMPYFVFTPVQLESFILKPGFSYRARYRIVTFDGEPDSKKIEQWYEDYLAQDQ